MTCIFLLFFVRLSLSQGPVFQLKAVPLRTFMLDEKKYWEIEVSLTNISAVTQNYISNTCSDDEFITTDTSLYQVKISKCPVHMFTLVHLSPSETRKTKVTMFCDGELPAFPALKFGMYFFFPEDNLFKGYETKLKMVSAIVWTEKIALP